MTNGVLWAAVGLGFGLGFAFVIRRFRGRFAQRRKAATPVTYASRQEFRKAARAREKQERKAQARSQ